VKAVASKSDLGTDILYLNVRQCARCLLFNTGQHLGDGHQRQSAPTMEQVFVVIARNPFCILGQQQIRPPRQLALLEMSYGSGWGFKRGAFGTIRNVWLEMRWHSAHLSIGPDEWINLPIRKRSRVFPFEHLRGAAAFLYV
jgi:hypothetical protein